MLYYPYLKDLDPDSEEAADDLKFVNSCDRMNKKLWALMGDDEINRSIKSYLVTRKLF